METTPVTNARFAAFVRETGYVTQAEQFGWSLVFVGMTSKNDGMERVDAAPWWARVKGATWFSPEGPNTSNNERLDHPVTHVTWADAQAYANWACGCLPTEGQWERAARGNLVDPRFPWGDDEPDDNTAYCNIWQGHFPFEYAAADGFSGTSSVHSFAANSAGMHDMAGNVWEWTSNAFRVRSVSRGARERNTVARHEAQKVLKGGSFLCHRSYCYRYRIAARLGLSLDTSASNVGFRLVYKA